jgi:integrase/recombinase XerD
MENIADLLLEPHLLKQGAAASQLEGFACSLATVGYTRLTIRDFLPSAIHFSGWQEAQGSRLAGIGRETVVAFGQHRCACFGGHRKGKRISPAYTARVQRFMDYLGSVGVAKARPKATAAVPPRLVHFRDWLLRHRGLALVTVERHERLISKMLPALGAEPARYDATSVRKIILEEIRDCRPAHAKTIVGALRIYLRFLGTTGECQPGLDQVLPTVAEWKLSSLPRYLDALQAARLIQSCESREPQGLRDRAIILLLIRLGLRGGDIAAMRPDDIDWPDASLLVRGKGRREIRLPLPQDAGDAVLDYLEQARPSVAIDRVFLCAKAPFRALRSGIVVSGIVRGALRRAGIENPPSHGANLLRHTAATTMLRGGATLEEIGAVLRHKLPNTTAHYAKVDVAALAEVAQPWPGENQ